MSFFKGVKKGTKDFGENISTLVNSLLLLIVYVIGVGLTAIVAKVMRKQFLDTKKKDSYWNELNLKKKEMKEYYRQF